MRKYFILFILIISTCNYSFAEERALTEELTIEIPTKFRQFELDGCDYFESNNGVSIRIISEDIEKLSVKKALASMDTRVFNLADYKLVEKVKDSIFELQKDYVKRYYEKDGDKVITYTFYTQEQLYSIFFTYKLDADEIEINRIIESIKYSPGLWRELVSIIYYSKFALFLLAILYCCFSFICVILFARGSLNRAYLVIFICYLILLAFLIMRFNGWWGAAIVYSITVHLAAQNFMKGNIDDGVDKIEAFDE